MHLFSHTLVDRLKYLQICIFLESGVLEILEPLEIFSFSPTTMSDEALVTTWLTAIRFTFTG